MCSKTKDSVGFIYFQFIYTVFWFWGSTVLEHDSSSVSHGPFVHPLLFICLAVSMEVGTSGCGNDASYLAKVSALS